MGRHTQQDRPTPTARGDIFQSKKCLHLKLEKDTHHALRSICFKRGLSMQEIFDDYAKLIVADDFRAQRMLDNLVMRNVKRQLEGLPRRQETVMSELDAETLYNLIEDQDPNDEEEPDEST